MTKTRQTANIIRCDWCKDIPLYIAYHDNEWGKLVTDDKVLFEFLILESAQAGLNWLTILQKRAGYKQAFADFNVQKVANFTAADIDRLMQFRGIIRNKLKIKAAITNAQKFIEIQQEFGSFYNYLVSFIDAAVPIVNNWQSTKQVPTTSKLSDAISADMKKRGFKFFGTTICYAYLQAVGIINDHIIHCYAK